MEKKEPYASDKEFSKRVFRYQTTPLVELVSCAHAHIVSGKKMTIIFVTLDPNSRTPDHRHESEQILVVSEGACDVALDGKLYHMEKGDVIVIPSKSKHGVYVSSEGCQTIEIFSPPREDYLAKLEAVMKASRT